MQGDWNAKTGEDASKNWKGTCGQYCNPETNEKGMRLLAFTSYNNLKMANTFGPHKPSRRWTWHSPGGDYHNQIDYIILPLLLLFLLLPFLFRLLLFLFIPSPHPSLQLLLLSLLFFSVLFFFSSSFFVPVFFLFFYFFFSFFIRSVLFRALQISKQTDITAWSLLYFEVT